jgi:NitT/TauT family transport system permease protein
MEDADRKPHGTAGPAGSPALRRARLILVFGLLGAVLGLAWLFLAHPDLLRPGLELHLPPPFLLLLSVASIALAFAAWLLGEEDLRRIKAGLVDRGGHKPTLAGYGFGVGTTAFFAVWVGVSSWITGPSLVRFFIFALTFVALLTLVVRLVKLRVRTDLPYSRTVVLTLLFIGVVLAVWWFVTRGDQEHRMVQSLILPSPMEVLRAFAPLHFEQGLVLSALASWLRVTTGFALAAIVALPLGVYMATFAPVAAFFRPLSLAGAYVPIVVLIPLSMTWFGTEEAQKIGFLFIGCFVALLPLVIKDIADVPSAFLDVAVTKGASQWQLVRHVLFPVAQANIWDHMRGVYGVGWGWIIMAEVFVRPKYGLGGLIEVSTRRSQTGSVYAIIIVIVLIAVACDQLWRLGGELLFPYRKTE